MTWERKPVHHVFPVRTCKVAKSTGRYSINLNINQTEIAFAESRESAFRLNVREGVNANGSSSFKFELHKFVRVCAQRDLSFCAEQDHSPAPPERQLSIPQVKTVPTNLVIPPNYYGNQACTSHLSRSPRCHLYADDSLLATSLRSASFWDM